MRICISWARAVTLAGTARQMSQAEAILPPPSAVMPTQAMPFFFASSMASSTFLLLPDVEMPNSTSPASPRACTWRAKTVSYP